MNAAKHVNRAIASNRIRILTISWIANSTEFFTRALSGHTEADIDAAIEHAVDLYVNRGETPGSAIPAGVRRVRRRIINRQAAEFTRDMIRTLMARQHTV